mmetsp:Transcript_12547/g.30541  ORF Transcript_12547/g.30541 Transcript_12547/m.30541 type:complete len:250 (+) Transcript_12547:903-1652(+)
MMTTTSTTTGRRGTNERRLSTWSRMQSRSTTSAAEVDAGARTKSGGGKIEASLGTRRKTTTPKCTGGASANPSSCWSGKWTPAATPSSTAPEAIGSGSRTAHATLLTAATWWTWFSWTCRWRSAFTEIGSGRWELRDTKRRSSSRDCRHARRQEHQQENQNASKEPKRTRTIATGCGGQRVWGTSGNPAGAGTRKSRSATTKKPRPSQTRFARTTTNQIFPLLVDSTSTTRRKAKLVARTITSSRTGKS